MKFQQCVKMIPQKQKLPMIFLKLTLTVLHQALFKKEEAKLTGHHVRLRNAMDQSYPICVCTRANHASYSSVQLSFCGSWMHCY